MHMEISVGLSDVWGFFPQTSLLTFLAEKLA